MDIPAEAIINKQKQEIAALTWRAQVAEVQVEMLSAHLDASRDQLAEFGKASTEADEE